AWCDQAGDESRQHLQGKACGVRTSPFSTPSDISPAALQWVPPTSIYLHLPHHTRRHASAAVLPASALFSYPTSLHPARPARYPPSYLLGVPASALPTHSTTRADAELVVLRLFLADAVNPPVIMDSQPAVDKRDGIVTLSVLDLVG
ncbi:hypothetical protein HaLaN_22841, partial [Haematococcus lacustris]